MNTTPIAILFALSGLALGAARAEPQGETAQPLEKVARPDALDRQAWSERMHAKDMAERERQYAGLVERALTDPDARALLEDWAADESDPLLAWTGRLAQRELELRLQAERAPEAPSFGHPRVFGDSMMSPFDRDLFQGFDAFRDLQRDLQGLLDRAPAPGMQQAPSGGSSSGESFSLQSGPDGVRVEMRTQVDGKEEVKTYEAKSMDELLQAHPELKGRIGAGGQGPLGLRRDLEGLLDRFPSRWRAFDTPGAPVRPDTERLGILMRPSGAWASDVAGLDGHEGIYVEQVFPGTLADALGLRAGQILVSLNGSPVATAEDVRAALSAREPGDEVVAELIDGRGQRRALSWRP